MPTVRIDDEVYKRLQEDAVPFVDTPNTVLRRLLGLQLEAGSEDQDAGPPAPGSATSAGLSESQVREEGSSRGTKRVRARRGTLLPEEEYELPILSVLAQAGGEAPARDVVDAVGELLKSRFTAADLQELPSGGFRWRNRTQWARNALCERGLLDRSAPRGIWSITDAGYDELDRQSRERS